MRKLLLLLLIVFSFPVINAQVSDQAGAIAKKLVAKNNTAIGLSEEDQQNSLVSATYKTMDGLQMVYLQQSYLGIPVYNQLQVLAFQNDKLVSNTGGRLPAIHKSIRQKNSMPAVSAVTALQTALLDVKAMALETAVPIFISPDGHKFEFGKLGATTENITADLLWYPVEGKNDIRLVWQVFITPRGSSAYWLIRVDATTNTVVDKTNLTITCNWDKKEHSVKEQTLENHSKISTGNYVIQQPVITRTWLRPDIISSVTYRVVKYPAESPNHPGGAPSLHTDPWNMAGVPAASLGWHNDGTVLHDSTRGNNVWAQEDRDASNTTFGNAALSTTAQPTLTLNYVYDITKDPADPTSDNQKAAITNLFYWNNIIHDIAYVYGLDEPSGNFQNNNQGRGGLGNDYVLADAQDASGTNNANFSPTVDGARPRMQMYLWTAPNPDRDGDLDNGIVAHEYTHGISNRYTGGPATASCLNNNEQGGEGWSDYFALMSTTNWAIASVNDGPVRRGVGTYVLNQSITGTGIRTAPYSTDMSIYPRTYADLPGMAIPHGVGEIWCMMLWEMTWEMIKQDNAINPNLFVPGPTASMIGNSAALKLVSEGMRLQPCNPGFVDARNAILRADTLLFNKKYSCSIWKAFAKRGLGRLALQGSSASSTDGVADFTVDASGFAVTESATQVQEGQNVTYTNTITAGNCTPVVNFFVTDTLPTHVTYVSGGSYNAGNRTITFSPVTMAANATQSFPFTVTVNNGSYFAPVTHFNETVANTGIPAAWTTTSATASVWTTSSNFSNSAPNSFFAANPTVASDFQLATTSAYTLLPVTASHYTTLSFWHRFNTEDGWDGGVVEISTNGGGNWTDLGSKMITGKYNGSMGTGSNNPIGGRAAFTGIITSFMKTTINLSSYAGQSVKIRFRFASDDNTAPNNGGWYIDDIVLYTEPAVYIKSNLFNASAVLQSFTDTLTRITQAVVCVPVSVATQPVNASGCSGGNVTFTITANGTNPLYQWQVNTGSGFVNVPAVAPYTGGTGNTLTISGLTAAMNGYQYRCVLSNGCAAPVNSGSATLAVGTTATLNSHPTGTSTCTGTNTSFSVSATSAGSFQWQVNTGSGFTDITNTAPYSGATTATLIITGVSTTMNGYQFRCVIGSCPAAIISNAAIMTVFAPVSVTTQPVSTVSVCQNGTTGFNVVAAGTITGYQWQVSTDGGTIFSNISGATTAALNLQNVSLTQNANRYRCVITGNCNTINSTNVLLTVNPTPSFTIGTIPSSLCVSDTAINLTASVAGGVWSGNGVQGTQFVPTTAGLGAAVLTYTVTNSFGCVFSQSATVQVNECPERHISLSALNSIIVYPNPGNGRFNIRVKSDLYKKLGMRVYASDGKLLKTQQFSGVMYDRILPVDLSRFPNGMYHLFLYNDETGVLFSKTVSIIISR